MTPLPTIALVGPTASGKSEVAMAMAEVLPVEIVSVDSALVYRGMDIGTAKPSLAQRAAVAHHLIDIRDPLQVYSAAQFANDAGTLIAQIRGRGRLPLLVGGTMLYMKALIDGLDAMPSADAQVRARLDAQAARIGWPAMHNELALVDPLTAARLRPNDGQRIQRALEVWQVSGRALSDWHKQRAPSGVQAEGKLGEQSPTSASGQTNNERASTTEPIALISLEPQDRAWLHARIAQRFDAMLREGLVDEVLALRARGDLNPSLPAMRCVGYRQTWEALDGVWPMSELRDRGIFATRQLAKRQLTWLRGMPSRHTIACDAPDVQTQVLQLVHKITQPRNAP